MSEILEAGYREADGLEPGAVCQWCGEPALAQVEIESAQHTRAGAVKKRAIVADVCSRHRRLVEREERLADMRRERVGLERALRTRLAPHGEAAARARERLAQIEAELRR